MIEILRVHADSLKHISFARNKVATEVLQFVCTELSKGFNLLESVDLQHLKENSKVNYAELLQCIALLPSGAKRQTPVRVYLSDYQTQLKRGSINEYMTRAKPNLELHFE